MISRSALTVYRPVQQRMHISAGLPTCLVSVRHVTVSPFATFIAKWSRVSFRFRLETFHFKKVMDPLHIVQVRDAGCLQRLSCMAAADAGQVRTHVQTERIACIHHSALTEPHSTKRKWTTLRRVIKKCPTSAFVSLATSRV
jgi:hypothetical protein